MHISILEAERFFVTYPLTIDLVCVAKFFHGLTVLLFKQAILMCEVAFTLLSVINQSVYNVLDRVKVN